MSAKITKQYMKGRLICLFKDHDWVLAPIPGQKSSPAYPTPDLIGKRLSHFCLRCGLTEMKIADLSRKQREWLIKKVRREEAQG